CARGGRSRVRASRSHTNHRGLLPSLRDARRKRTAASWRPFLRRLPCRTCHKQERSCVPISLLRVRSPGLKSSENSDGNGPGNVEWFWRNAARSVSGCENPDVETSTIVVLEGDET